MAAVTLPLLGACLATAPQVAHRSAAGVVRGADERETREVAEMLARLEPQILALLPDTDLTGIEVWIQDEPHLYRFPQAAGFDAEGLYSPAHDRILLSRRAQDMERVLAHELVHAALGSSWSRLPGTLEEGLCDAVAARLSDNDSARLRAGRLSGAALACGGLQLELDVRERDPVSQDLRLGWSARITLTGQEDGESRPMQVFEVSAGRSSTRLESSSKRSFYGLSFLVVECVVDRHGFEGLAGLCERASEEGLRKVPSSWLLEAAGLDSDPAAWRAAAVEQMGNDELVELVRMYPGFVADSLAGHLVSLDLQGPPESWLDAIQADLSLVGGEASVRVTQLDFLREEVLTRLLLRR